MSKALQYLMKARPGAMQAYFAFLRDNGSRLDPKTRALISIITKAANQTEAGLKQYTTRALREGVSADEILDALLMAFPALGLSKIVWAVDVLLTMNIPEFALEPAGTALAWHDVCAVETLPEQGVTRVACGGRAVFVVTHGGDMAVYDSRCPHEGTDIQDESVSGWDLVCPRHGWEFDLKTGACTSVGGITLAVYNHKVESGYLYAQW
jgi:nitrite reductase/ring-hydroxylating ferredoxin subunit/alkylhydroperoxidase/carboxymuconolactone decarboxylase family protein YurZ